LVSLSGLHSEGRYLLGTAFKFIFWRKVSTSNFLRDHIVGGDIYFELFSGSYYGGRGDIYLEKL
jgi:hypothetical protein